MLNLTLHLGDSTFVVEKNVLSKFVGVFESDEKLKTATSYNIKSKVQKQAFLMFLHAVKSNVFPRVTPEIWKQLVALSEEFKCNELRLYLIQNKQRLTNNSMRKANIRKAYTLINTENFFDIFQNENDRFSSNVQNKLQKNDKNKETKENPKSNNKKNLKLSDDNDYGSSYSYYSSSYSIDSDGDIIFSDDEEIEQESEVDFDRSSDDELIPNEDENINNNENASQNLTSSIHLTTIQKMARELQKALFGISSDAGNSITTQNLYNQKNIDEENVSFQNKIARLDYVLFGHKREETHVTPAIPVIPVTPVIPISINLHHEESDVCLFSNIGAKRKPRHTFRHLPSIIFQDD